MKLTFISALLISVMVCSLCAAQDRKTSSGVLPVSDTAEEKSSVQFSLEMAHPNARALMKEDFYWSSIEETGPFGSDDGWEAAQRFREWRATNKTGNPVSFLKGLIAEWEYPYFDWKETDSTKIKAHILAGMKDMNMEEVIQQMKKAFREHPDTSMRRMDDAQIRELVLSSTRGMNGTFLLGQDNAIIGTAFAQLVLEGRINRELKELTIIAIQRQLLPVLINKYGTEYRSTRKEQLMKMLAVMNKLK